MLCLHFAKRFVRKPGAGWVVKRACVSTNIIRTPRSRARHLHARAGRFRAGDLAAQTARQPTRVSLASSSPAPQFATSLLPAPSSRAPNSPAPQLPSSPAPGHSPAHGHSPARSQDGRIEKGRSDVAVALVLEGFPLRTLLEPMPQRHWATPDRCAGGDGDQVPRSPEVPTCLSRSVLTPPPNIPKRGQPAT